MSSVTVGLLVQRRRKLAAQRYLCEDPVQRIVEGVQASFMEGSVH
jgi:hypothetical protein